MHVHTYCSYVSLAITHQGMMHVPSFMPRLLNSSRHTLLYVCWMCVEQAIQADLATSQELVAASVAIYMFTAGLGALLWVRMSCYLQQGY